MTTHNELVGTRWQHYKSGDDYLFDAVARNPNTGELIIVYRQPGDVERYWRPYAEFFSKFKRVSK